MRQPPTIRLKIPTDEGPARPKFDADGYVVLSEKDIDRIVERLYTRIVAERLLDETDGAQTATD
jgi:hypothetical protein